LPRSPARTVGLVLGCAAFGLLAFGPGPFGEPGSRPALAAGVTALMALFWLSEALPIHWTACVPLVAFPLLGVLPGGPLANLGAALAAYLDPYIFLFLGGMCIAAAMQQQDLHRRLALTVLRRIGTEPRRLLLGVIVACAAMSMWISNTATATMMLPIGLAIVGQLEARAGKRLEHFGAALMLAIAYASNVGGIGTKIGTAPNALLAGFLAGQGREVSFLQFAVVGTGFALLFLPVVWLALWRVGRRDAPREHLGRELLDHELARLGPVKRAEWPVLAVFAVTAALWIAARPLTGALRPAAQALGLALRTAHVEGGLGMLAALVLLLLRVDARRVLEPRALLRLPWSTLVLLGGGFAMAVGVQESGLSELLAQRMSGLGDLSPLAQVGSASAATVGISALASNTATIAVMLNVLNEAAAPALATTVLFAATLASSCDFALPAGTPPNAIVFGSGYLTVPRMARTGLALDLAAAVVVTLWCLAVVPLVL
jgi:sodium-dependent dicarboxylate transporter 2/3/5